MSIAKYKVAVLDDDKLILKSSLEELKSFPELIVVAFDTNSDNFISKVQTTDPDFLILDIELNGDSRTGLQVAQLLKKPVVFLSAKTRENLNDIKFIQYEEDYPVDFIMKSTSSILKKGLEKYIEQLESYLQQHNILLKVKGDQINVNRKDIVVITTDKEHGSGSGNKVVYFTNRPGVILIDTNFAELRRHGLNTSDFIQIHKSILLNKNKVTGFKNRTFTVPHLDMNGKMITNIFKVPEEISEETKQAIIKAGFKL